MFGAVYGYGQQKEDEATKEANPDSPWLWRKDWAANRAQSLKRNTVYGWWIGAGLVSMITVPILTNALPPLLRDSDPKALLLIGFSLIPAILLVGAVRATIRRERYGKTCFEFGSLPFSPGSRVNGQIQLRLNTAARPRHRPAAVLHSPHCDRVGQGPDHQRRCALEGREERAAIVSVGRPTGYGHPGGLRDSARTVSRPTTISPGTSCFGCCTHKPMFPAWITRTTSKSPCFGRARVRSCNFSAEFRTKLQLGPDECRIGCRCNRACISIGFF